MELTRNVKTSGHVHCFEMKNLWGTNKKKGTDEDEFVNPTEYFSFAISCDKNPNNLVERMSFEWICVDGQKLMIKDLLLRPFLSIETPISM